MTFFWSAAPTPSYIFYSLNLYSNVEQLHDWIERRSINWESRYVFVWMYVSLFMCDFSLFCVKETRTVGAIKKLICQSLHWVILGNFRYWMDRWTGLNWMLEWQRFEWYKVTGRFHTSERRRILCMEIERSTSASDSLQSIDSTIEAFSDNSKICWPLTQFQR